MAGLGGDPLDKKLIHVLLHLALDAARCPWKVGQCDVVRVANDDLINGLSFGVILDVWPAAQSLKRIKLR